MITCFAAVFGALMNMFYAFFKLRRTKNKIVFISRQSQTPPLDFQYLIREIKTHYPQYEMTVLCKMIPDSFGGKLAYIFEMFRQMQAMATAKVVVLDGYCILASMLTHKQDLKIIQLWHALGAFKKFGKSVLDKEGGKSSALAEAFKMHRNYDLIAASGNQCVAPFAEAFGQPEEKFVPIGIPRMDYLTDDAEMEQIKNKILLKYPMLDNGKKNILYAPTFRDTPADKAALQSATEALINAVNYSECNLIIKHHVVDSNKEIIYVDSRVNQTTGESFTGMDFMALADAVVTDYSSVIFEAVLKNLPLYLYCFDSDAYLQERGFYIDFWQDIPALYSKHAKGICTFIAEDRRVENSKTEEFQTAYVHKHYPCITAVWAEIIDELMQGKYDNRYNDTHE